MKYEEMINCLEEHDMSDYVRVCVIHALKLLDSINVQFTGLHSHSNIDFITLEFERHNITGEFMFLSNEIKLSNRTKSYELKTILIPKHVTLLVKLFDVMSTPMMKDYFGDINNANNSSNN